MRQWLIVRLVNSHFRIKYDWKINTLSLSRKLEIIAVAAN